MHHPEEAEDERDCREEREQRAVCDLLREAHAVVGHELRDRSLQDGPPLGEAQPQRPARRVAGVGLAHSRPRRKIKRAVAPIPPARTKPAPRAPAATSGSLLLSLPATSVASPTPSRSDPTAWASRSRSASISRRTSSSVRVGIAPQRLGRAL